MGKKNKAKKQTGRFEPEDFKVNPFAGLSLEVSEPKAMPAQIENVAPAPASKPQTLSPEDRALLKEFGEQAPDEYPGKTASPPPRGPRVSLQLEKKGHRGKPVTLVKGLADLETVEQMALLQSLRRELGVGGRFRDTLVEVQGDQRQRLAQWLAERGFRVAASS
jgi:translation initiation factor 1